MTNEGWPLVTVITVVYNGQEYLEDAIKSVIGQSYPNIEYIVIDGGSTDGTLDIIHQYKKQIDFWVSEKDDGIYDAMNKGLEVSTGEIIGILNSDDWYELDAVEKVVQEFIADKDLDLVYGAMNILNRDGSTESTYGSKEGFSGIFSTPFNHPTCFFHKNVYRKIGLFDLQFPTAADYDFMLRFKRSAMKYHYIDTPLSNFRKVGVTSKSILFPVGQIWRVLRKNQYRWYICLAAIIVRAARVAVVVSVTFLGGRKLKRKLRTFLGYHRKSSL